MAWTVAAGGRDRGRALIVAELATGAFPKTLTWGTDLAEEAALGANAATQSFQIEGIRTELTTTATAGPRTLKVQLLDANDDVLSEWVAVDTTAASLTQLSEWFDVGAAPNATPIGTVQYERFPGFTVPPGAKVRVTQDGAVVDALDTLLVFLRGRLIP